MLEECVLPRGQDQWRAMPKGAPRPRVQFERTHSKTRRRERTTATPDHGSQPRQQFAEVEGLGEVIVSTTVEGRDARLDGVARGQHQDGNDGTLSPDLTADRQPVLPREQDVEDDRVVLGKSRLIYGPLAICNGVDCVTL
jgi:hypothetical protein